MKYNTAYIAPTLTVDLVAFEIIDNQLCVLLARRPEEPFKDSWALPGGYNPEGETTIEALERIIMNKVGIRINKNLAFVEQLYTFDTVARDPRGHAVSVTYMGCGQNIALDKSRNAKFFPINKLPKNIAFDHDNIIKYAHSRLSAKIGYTNAAFAFLQKSFTLTELQQVYQAIFGRNLDKRNVRKKFLSLDLVKETGEMRSSVAHRPAKLYTFSSQKLQDLPRSFD